MKQFLKKGKAEGSVLFTVVAVMLVMVVFLMSTMVLTTSAHRRSYYTFHETQAQYAAQAAIDAVTNSAYTDHDFYDWVHKFSENKKNGVTPVSGDVTVSFNGSGINFTGGNDQVVCTIEVIDNLMTWDDTTRAVHPQIAYKLTATAHVGNGRNASEYTVCNYIYENYRVENPEMLPSVDNNASNTVHTWTRGGGGVKDWKNSTINAAVFSLGPTTSGNNMTYFGPQSLGMTTIPDGRTLYDGSGHDLMKTNDNYAVGDMFVVGNYVIPISYAMHVTFERFGESAQFYGNLVYNGAAKLPNQGVSFASIISEGAMNNELALNGEVPYNRQPYVYVDGCIMSTSGGGMYFGQGHDMNGRTDETYNVNVFCGGIKTFGDAGTEFSVAGDAYLYDPAIDSDIDGMSGHSVLAKFAMANVTKSNTQWDDMTVGGNLICNNKSLTLNSNGKGMTIDGDLIMTNPSGELIIRNPITVMGKVLVAGTISDDSLSKLNCNTIVTKTFAIENGNPVDAEDYFDYLYTNYGDGAYDEILGDNYASYIANPNSMALMPFSYRLDEIFDKYLRWDLKSTDINQAAENAANDPLVAESIACGHSWQDASGAWQMMAFKADDTTVATRFEEVTYEKEAYDNEAQSIEREHPEWVINHEGWSADLRADGQSHWETCWYTVTEQNPVEWEVVSGVTVYVPYTTAIRNNAFIPHFEPLTNTSSLEAMVSSDYFIDDIGKFTAGMETAPTYSINDGTHRDVPVAFHDNSNGNPVIDKALNNALIIEDNCYLDLNNFNDGNIFINPAAKDHDNDDPLRVVIRGNSNCGGIIVINNTADYSADYSSYTMYTNSPPKKQVWLFFEDGFTPKACNGFRIFMSGAYGQAIANSRQSGELHVVSNPLRPGDDNFDEQDYKTKYAYELVPNTLVFGQAGAEYNFDNGGIIHAEVLMPTAYINVHNSSNYSAKIYYQEEWNSAIYSTDYTAQGKNGLPCFGLGTMITANLNSEPNTASVVYIGDLNGYSIDEPQDSSKESESLRSDKLGNEDIDYFNNDHIGAS